MLFIQSISLNAKFTIRNRKCTLCLGIDSVWWPDLNGWYLLRSSWGSSRFCSLLKVSWRHRPFCPLPGVTVSFLCHSSTHVLLVSLSPASKSWSRLICYLLRWEFLTFPGLGQIPLTETLWVYLQSKQDYMGHNCLLVLFIKWLSYFWRLTGYQIIPKTM